MPRKDKHGNLIIHPKEMPDDFESAADPNDPFIRKQFESETTTRPCKICGKRFTLGVPYDPENVGHDLCENCILEVPVLQKYPATTYQIDQTMIDALPTEYKEEYHKNGEREEE